MKIILCVLFLLTACAVPPPVFKPVTVDVPVTAPCATPATEPPASPLSQTPANAPLFEKVKAALIEIDMRKAYEARLETALEACR